MGGVAGEECNLNLHSSEKSLSVALCLQGFRNRFTGDSKGICGFINGTGVMRRLLKADRIEFEKKLIRQRSPGR